MNGWWLLITTLGCSLLLTGGLRNYALSAQRLMDVPNARSAHSTPTPRGGGVAIAVSFLLALFPVLYWEPSLEYLVWALFGAGLGVALLGFLDDHGHIAARWRLLGHFIAAGWALYWLQGFPPLSLAGWVVDLGWIGNLLAAVYLVWLLNLYNFMDGLDGLASVEAIFVCLGSALIFVGSSNHWALVVPELLLACAVAGFLFWNAPPARIFMGDAGSGFLGISLGILSIQAAKQAPELLWSWLILLGVFIVDATLTLLRRLFLGEKLYQAHCRHAYQYAARYYGGHLPVTLGVSLINLFWLLPLACAVGWGYVEGLVGLVIAYIPLIALALRFRAGLPEQSGSKTG